MSSLAPISVPADRELDPGSPVPVLLSEPHERLAIALLLGFGFAMRWIAARQLTAFALFDTPTAEAAESLRRAAAIASGHAPLVRPFDGGVWYPYVIVAFHALGGPAGLALAQAIAGTAVVALSAYAARRLGGPVAAIATATLGALYGPFGFLGADTLDVTWVLLAVAAALAALLGWSHAWARDPRRSHPGGLLLAGVALALAAIERPHLVGLVLVAWGWVAWRARAARPLIAVCAGSLVPVAIVMALAVSEGSVGATRGAEYWIGNHAGADGTTASGWQPAAPEFAARPADAFASGRVAAESLAHRALTPEEVSAFWIARSGSFARSRPAAAAALAARKFGRAFNAFETPADLDFHFVREHAWALNAMPFGFGPVLPLAVIGIGFAFIERRRRADLVLLAAAAGAIAAGLVVFVVSERLRAPLVLPLLVAAGAGVRALLSVAGDPARRRDPHTLRVWLAALAAVGLVLLPMVHRDAPREGWLLARASIARGDLAGAAGAYEAAIDATDVPRERGFLLQRLAGVYRAMGLDDLALRSLRESVQADPDAPLAHKQLGMLLSVKGDPAHALYELRESVRLGGDDPESLGVIAALLALHGDRAEAVAMFARARALAPADPGLAELARAYPAVVGGTPPAKP